MLNIKISSIKTEDKYYDVEYKYSSRSDDGNYITIRINCTSLA